MSSEHTEQQSTDDLIKSRDLSLESISPPAQIAGYTIQKCVGQGAYGEVWSGISRKTGRKVAIKFYTRRSSSDVQMLAAEVEKLAVIGTDRYVVQLLDVGWDSEPPYYVMDYIEHGSLEDRLKEDDTIAPSEAIEIFQEIATGMMHLHSKGILHCDLKPGNVLLDQDGKPRLADFGQSRLGDDDTPALGTLFYMAPEQADTEAAPDARWDVYGLGALFYSMLTGRPPYYREDLAREIEQTVDLPSRLATYRQGLQTAPLPDDHRKIPGVDRALADIIDQCISADRKGRFGSVQSVLLALKQREESRARRPVMLLGLIGPLLLTAVISLFGWWAIRQAVSDAVEAVTNKAEYTNQFAAELGAANAGAMFDQYFLSIDRLLNEEEFKEHFKELVSEETLPLRLAVSDPVDNKKKDFEARQALVQRMKEDSSIQAMLNERVNNFYGRYPTSASWFVCDTFGNQLVSAFWDPDTGCVLEDEDTLGKNWSYRTYFTALSSDLNQETGYEGVSRDPFQRTMITAPHISTYFQSKQSGTLKVAFSAPIEDNGQIIGILACTVELGSLISFPGNADQYAMLIDGREGPDRGVILEHPLYQDIMKRNLEVPIRTVNLSHDVEFPEVASPFLDPVADIEGGEDYGEPHLAAIAAVRVKDLESRKLLPEIDPEEREEVELAFKHDTGLFVIAAESQEDVVAPAYALGRTLGWISLGALALLLAVAVTMWILVNRMMRESRERLARAFAPSNESSMLERMETVAATTRGPGTMTLGE